MKILDGKTAAQALKDQLKTEIAAHTNSGKRPPHLVAVLVGDDPASQTYVNSKIKNCNAIGITSTFLKLDASIAESELLETIKELNDRSDVDGILVQVPLPEHISEKKVTLAIDPSKDVDGFHPENIGNMVLGLPGFISATPLGILLLLKHFNISPQGKHAVVVGRSNNVGTPVSILLSRNNETGNATVTLCHSRTRDLKNICRQADILIAAIGKPDFITADMVKENAVVIDVGINRVGDSNAKKGYILKGDVDFEEVKEKCSYITPVPGGVGPMTIAALLQNTFDACKRNLKNNEE